MNNIQPEIIFEDGDFAVINKPFGMVVNKADSAKDSTVQEWAEKILQIANSHLPIADNSEFIRRGGIVHRLDKDTSGILLIAKNEDAFINLQKQFKDRVVHKKYLALVHGLVAPGAGVINAPIERNPFNRMRFGVFPGGREAVTEYKTLTNYRNTKGETYSLLEVFPKTGRTHQIRVHLKHLNHSIVSDVLYGGRKILKDDLKLVARMFLHAASIELHHPKTDNIIKFECELPEVLAKALNNLQLITDN